MAKGCTQINNGKTFNSEANHVGNRESSMFLEPVCTEDVYKIKV